MLGAYARKIVSIAAGITDTVPDVAHDDVRTYPIARRPDRLSSALRVRCLPARCRYEQMFPSAASHGVKTPFPPACLELALLDTR